MNPATRNANLRRHVMPNFIRQFWFPIFGRGGGGGGGKVEGGGGGFKQACSKLHPNILQTKFEPSHLHRLRAVDWTCATIAHRWSTPVAGAWHCTGGARSSNAALLVMLAMLAMLSLLAGGWLVISRGAVPAMLVLDLTLVVMPCRSGGILICLGCALHRLGMSVQVAFGGSADCADCEAGARHWCWLSVC